MYGLTPKLTKPTVKLNNKNISVHTKLSDHHNTRGSLEFFFIP